MCVQRAHVASRQETDKPAGANGDNAKNGVGNGELRSQLLFLLVLVLVSAVLIVQ